MSSSRPPANTTTTDDLAWLTYLRSAGGTVPERSASIDRKRRHTGAQHEGPGRSYPYPTSAASSSANIASTPPRRPSAMSGTSGESGVEGTAAAPIDLTSPPAPRSRPPPPPTQHRSSTSSARQTIRDRIREHNDSRRSSEIRSPRWQPDHEASQCPVCKTDFGFWNRRHHCRKCGRVVCSACSPHRITIPRPYIVQPPNPFGSEFGVDQSAEGETSRVLGGGEVVRVCNPCVPDPWTPENANVRGGEETSRPRPLIEGARNAGDATVQEDPRRRYMPMPPPPQPPQTGAGRHRSQSHQPATSTLSRSIPQPPPPPSHNRAYSRPSPGPPFPHQSRSISHRYSHSHTSSIPPVPPFTRASDPSRPPITTTPSAPPHTRPRREVREEDECPVCGAEMPPGEQVREAHVQECIASRFSSSTPASSHMPHPSPRQSSHRQQQHNAAAASQVISDLAASASTPPSDAAGRPRATSYRPRGMALYTATEKDCLDPHGTGEPQECVICLEEFQPGEEMGRMECLCKFHRACIRGWWERKGVGSCPTHQLHD